VKLGQVGSEVEAAGRAFDRVAGPETAARLSEVTDGLVRASTAQRAYGQAARSGLGNAELLRYFDLTATAAREMGRDVTEAVTSAGSALETMTRDDALERLDRLENEFGGIDSEARNVADAFGVLETAASDAFDEFAEGFASSGELISELNRLGVALDSNGVAWEAYGEAIGNGTSRLLAAGRVFLSLSGSNPLQGLISAFDVLANGTGMPGTAPAPPPVPDGSYDLPEILVSGSTNRGRRGGGASRPADSGFWGDVAAGEAAEEQARLAGEIAQQEERLASVEKDRLETERLLNEEVERRQTIYDKEAELIERQLDLVDSQLEADEMLAAQRRESLSSAMSQLQQYAGAADTLGNSLASVFGELASREEEGSEGAKKWAKAQGAVLAAFSFVKSAVEFALAIASGASQDYGEMAGHIAAGIALAAAGAMAVSDLGGQAKSGQTNAAAAQGSRFSAQAEREEAKPEGGQVTIWTMGYGSSGLGRELQRASRSYSRSGLDGQMAAAGAWGG
jgi:hypothetical protein